MKKCLIFSLCVLIFIIGMKCLLLHDIKTISTDNLHKVNEYDSPNGSYTLELYFKNGGRFFADYSYIGHLINNETGQSRNLLWLGPTQRLFWKDDHSIVINDHAIENGKRVVIEKSIVHVKTDIYDFRWDSVNYSYGWKVIGVLMLLETLALLKITLTAKKVSKRMCATFSGLTVFILVLSVFLLIGFSPL